MAARRRCRTEALGGAPPNAPCPRVIFTHLFSAPLTEREMAKGGSGCQMTKAVPELSYQGERETLVRTLTESKKAIQFMSEAANTDSFGRAVGCPNEPTARDSSSHPRSSSEPCPAGLPDSVRSCRDGECRMLHFTGHAQPGKLTFEDKYGQLQYIDEAHLLAMLRCKKKPAGDGSCGTARTSPPRVCTPARSADLSPRGSSNDSDHGAMGGGYALFEDTSNQIAALDMGDGSPGKRKEAAADVVNSLPKNEEAKRASRSGLQLVFLSSCHSASLAQVFIEAGVRHVIAVKAQEKILDHKAHDFAKSFYSALFRGDTVQEAFSVGIDRLIVSPDRANEGEKFVLLPTREQGGDHDIPVFEAFPPGPFDDLSAFQPLYPCEVVTEHFWGRAVEVQKVVRHMVDEKRCITILGQKGIGKTQVLLKASAYARERHVFGDIFFCRVEQGRDACQWLEKGFALPPGSLVARTIDAAVATISQKVTQRQAAQHCGKSGSRAPRRSLLVLDRCERHLLVGGVRVELSVLLNRLFRALPNLTAAVTLRATSPTALEGVGVAGEEVVVVNGLDDRSTAELFVKCCPRKLDAIEIDPSRQASFNSNREPDFVQAMDAFASSDIVRALRGHPGCVVDLLRRVGLENLSVFLHRERLLERDIPEIQGHYAYPENGSTMQQPIPRQAHPVESWRDAFDRIICSGAGNGLYTQRQTSAPKTWRELCGILKSCFARRVPGAHGRPLSSEDLEVFAEDEALWGDGQAPPAARKSDYGGNVDEVVVPLENFRHFWRWFWLATDTLRLTMAWEAGKQVGVRAFAGFMKKVTANRMIASAAPGTFLMRFSNSKGGALAVHYKNKRDQVISVLVDVDDGGQLSVPPAEGTPKVKHRNLAALVMSVRHIQILHPDIPKKVVFATPRHRSSFTEGMRSGAGGGGGRRSMGGDGRGGVPQGGGGYGQGHPLVPVGGVVVDGGLSHMLDGRRRRTIGYA